jgi:beta-mannanase
MPAIVNVGSDWATYPNFDPTVMNNIRARGALPMYSWLPDNYTYANYDPQPVYSLANIINHHFDAYIWQFARAAKAWGHPFFLRFAHEMNGNWYPWSTGSNNPDHNTVAQYVTAWRYVYNIFQLAGATNVIWVWCVNTDFPGSTPIAQDYPGNTYVDWVAIDGFNWGNTPGHQWESLNQVFGPTYAEVAKITNKPIMIAETGSSEQGGNKAAWITQGFLTQLPQDLPRVRAVMWFDEDLLADLSIDSSPAALAAYRSVVASPLFQAHVVAARGVATICSLQSSTAANAACSDTNQVQSPSPSPDLSNK